MKTIYTKHFYEHSQLLYKYRDLFLDGEIWKEIPDTNGKYYVSSFGRVLSLCYKEPHILKPQVWGKKYLCV